TAVRPAPDPGPHPGPHLFLPAPRKALQHVLRNRWLLAVGVASMATFVIGGLLLALRGPGPNGALPSSLVANTPAISKTQRGSPQTGKAAISPFEALAARGISPALRPAGALKNLVAVLGDGIQCIAVSGDGRSAALGRSTGSCRLYNVLDGQETAI